MKMTNGKAKRDLMTCGGKWVGGSGAIEEWRGMAAG